MTEQPQTGGAGPPPGGFRPLVRRVRQTAGGFLVISAYLWVILSLFALHESILAPGEGFLYGQGVAVLNALVLGKVVYFAEHFRVGEKFETRPLIYPILFKSGLFALILVGFRLIENALRGALSGLSVSESLSEVGGGTLPGILSVGVIIFVVLIPFFAFRELVKLVGRDVMRELLLKRRRRLAPVADRDDASAGAPDQH
jgi:hypothetical protein